MSILCAEEACYLYKEVDASRRVEGRPLIPMLAGLLIDAERSKNYNKSFFNLICLKCLVKLILKHGLDRISLELS